MRVEEDLHFSQCEYQAIKLFLLHINYWPPKNGPFKKNQQELDLRRFFGFSGQILKSPYRLLYIYVRASYENLLVHRL